MPLEQPNGVNNAPSAEVSAKAVLNADANEEEIKLEEDKDDKFPKRKYSRKKHWPLNISVQI